MQEAPCADTPKAKETIMREMFQSSIMVAIAAAGAVIAAPIWQTAAQAPSASGGAPPPTTLNTPWGEPDLQGIWTDETDTLLQRSPKYADQEFFTEAQRAELDRERSVLLSRRATELNLVGVGGYSPPLEPRGRRHHVTPWSIGNGVEGPSIP